MAEESLQYVPRAESIPRLRRKRRFWAMIIAASAIVLLAVGPLVGSGLWRTFTQRLAIADSRRHVQMSNRWEDNRDSFAVLDGVGPGEVVAYMAGVHVLRDPDGTTSTSTHHRYLDTSHVHQAAGLSRIVGTLDRSVQDRRRIIVIAAVPAGPDDDGFEFSVAVVKPASIFSSAKLLTLGTWPAIKPPLPIPSADTKAQSIAVFLYPAADPANDARFTIDILHADLSQQTIVGQLNFDDSVTLDVPSMPSLSEIESGISAWREAKPNAD